MSYRKKQIKLKIKKLRPKKSILKNKWLRFLILFFIAVIFALYLFFFFPKIQVSKIDVTGNQEVKTQEIEEIAKKNISNKLFSIGNWQVFTKNIFLVNASNIDKEILNKFPKIESAKTEKKLFETISIEIIERKPKAIFCDGADSIFKNCYFVDKNGIVFNFQEALPTGFIIIQKQAGDSAISAGKKAVKTNILDAIFKMEKLLKDNFNIEIKEALIANAERMNMLSNERWQIYFNLEQDMDLQIAKLNLLLQSEISENARKKLQYIDLRFKGRAYYK